MISSRTVFGGGHVGGAQPIEVTTQLGIVEEPVVDLPQHPDQLPVSPGAGDLVGDRRLLRHRTRLQNEDDHFDGDHRDRRGHLHPELRPIVLHAENPLIASPINLAPITSIRTAMITALL